MVDFLSEVINLGYDISDEPKSMPLASFVEKLGTSLDWPEHEINDSIEIFSLEARADFLSPPEPYLRRDVYPWRFNRPLSYMRKPLILREANDSAEEVVWGNRHVFAAAMYLVELCFSGRLEPREPAMRRLCSIIRSEEAEEFNDRVAELYERLPDRTVRRRVKKIENRRIQAEDGRDLGDIDVLVVYPPERRVLVVECKCLLIARTPREMSNELDKLFGTKGSTRSIEEKHLARADWCRRNLDSILRWIGSEETDTTGWRVDPLLVFDSESLSWHLVTPGVPAMSFLELEQSATA